MASRIARKPCYGLAEVCTRWGVSEADIANFAIAGELTLSVVVARLPIEDGEIEEVEDGHFVELPERRYWFTGGLDLWAQDAWHVVMDGSHAVHAFKVERGRYRSLRAQGDDPPELIVQRERIVVQHAELLRFESAQAEPAQAIAHAPAGQRGAPARYAWDEFWCEAAVALQIEGMPPTQAALVRRMEQWFAGRGEFPDQSTIKKKVALLWRRYAEALARPSA